MDGWFVRVTYAAALPETQGQVLVPSNGAVLINSRSGRAEVRFFITAPDLWQATREAQTRITETATAAGFTAQPIRMEVLPEDDYAAELQEYLINPES